MSHNEPGWCRRFAKFSLAALLVTACADTPTAAVPEASVAQTRLEPIARSDMEVPRTAWSSRYYEGYLAETVRGDLVTARAAYRDVLDGADAVDASLAARAALRLAALEGASGRPREAAELAARATALGKDDQDVLERAEQLRDAFGAFGDAKSLVVRGPALGTTLTGVSKAARDSFAEGEQLFAAFYRVNVRPRIEDPQAGARARLRAAEAAERAYERVVELGEPSAAAAAQLRIGALYHDLAIALVSESPPELEGHAMARLRSQQRRKAVQYLRTARDAYRRSVAIESDESSPWRRAAEKGINSADDLLRWR